MKKSSKKDYKLETYQKSLNRSGVHMYSVGVGDKLVESELKVNFNIIKFKHKKNQFKFALVLVSANFVTVILHYFFIKPTIFVKLSFIKKKGLT